MKPTEPRVLMTMTDVREIHGFATFTKQEAEDALTILNLEPQQRYWFAVAALNAIGQLLTAGYLGPDSTLSMVGKMPVSQLAVESIGRLPWKRLSFICKCIQKKDEHRLRFLRQDLERVAAGLFENNELLQPFLHAEGVV